jgi:hypothetical protein
LDAEYLSPFQFPSEQVTLEPDPRFCGEDQMVRAAAVFGGDAEAAENTIWVSHDQHVQLVQWWNSQYQNEHEERA